MARRLLSRGCMIENDWTAIRDQLKGIGVYVELESLYFQQRQPFWRAHASREGRTWVASGSDLNDIFTELQTLAGRETRLAVHPHRETSSRAMRVAGRGGRGRYSSL